MLFHVNLQFGQVYSDKLSFDTYNESNVLTGAIERYRKHIGYYLERAMDG